MGTKIEWTEETWNPIIGCSKVSPGCDHCYAERMANRLANMPMKHNVYAAAIKWEAGKSLSQWNGTTHLVESALSKPLHWKKPRTVFVCSMSDLFHHSTDEAWIDKVFAIMAMCPHHTFQVLTKRPEKAREYFQNDQMPYRIQKAIDGIEVDEEMRRVPEEWRDIPGFEGQYQASNYGEIRAIKTEMPRKLTNNVTRGGYYKVSLCVNGEVSQHRTHRLVLMTFNGMPDSDQFDGRHKNGNVQDNRVANLIWGSKSDNMMDASRHGTAGAYMKSQTQFTRSDIESIRRLRSGGMKLDEIARLYNTNRKRVSKIVNNQIFKDCELPFPLPNVWLGVTAENQEYADKRTPILLQIPAAKRFVSIEPMLGLVDLKHINVEPYGFAKHVGPPEFHHINALTGYKYTLDHKLKGAGTKQFPSLDWVICGGESGPRARPMNPSWARSLRDQCQAADVPFFFKQWGEWHPNWHEMSRPDLDYNQIHTLMDDGISMCRVGKKRAGRELDGKIWNQKP